MSFSQVSQDSSSGDYAGSLSPERSFLIAALVASLNTLFMGLFIGDQRNVHWADTDWYRAMAAGKPVVKPFANRVLGPFVAHQFGVLSHRSDAVGFFILALLSIWIFTFFVLLPVLRRRQAVGLVPALLFMVFWQELFTLYYLPDLFHAALVAIFLYLLERRWWAASAAMMIPMYLAREATLLMVLISVPVVWILVGRRVGGMFLGASAAAFASLKIATRHALPNIHHIDDLLYMIGKVPWNLAKSIFGMDIRTNNDPFVPNLHTFELPRWIHLGSIHAILYSSPGPQLPLMVLAGVLMIFGLGPVMVLCLVLRRRLHQILPQSEPCLWVAALYGLLSYLLAPALGTRVLNLLGYGWPLFLFYLPAVIPRFWRHWRPWQVIVLLVLHLFLANLQRSRGIVEHIPYAFAASLLGFVLLWITLGPNRHSSESPEPASAQRVS